MIDIDDVRFKEFVINKMIPFPVMLNQAGMEGYNYNSNCYCPFHENYQTPSAKLYKNERGDSLWCFSEQKMYFPSDVIKKELINRSLETIFIKVWNQCSEDLKEKLIALYEKPVDFIPEGWKTSKELLFRFRSGEVDIETHLEYIVNSI